MVNLKRVKINHNLNSEHKLKSCPLCGRRVELVDGPEFWTPSYYDPDSGGNPYLLRCKCGVEFKDKKYREYKDFVKKWNKRVRT